MSQMRRLKDETRSPFARALVESAAGDRSESGACDRALRALGVGTAAGAVAATSTAKAAALASTAGTGGGTLSVAPTAAKGGALLLVKWVGVAAIGGAAAIGAAPYVRDAIAPAAPRPTVPTVSAPPPAAYSARPASAAPIDHAIPGVESPSLPPAVIGTASAAAPPVPTELPVPATRPREAPSPRTLVPSAAEAPPAREADSVGPQLTELNAARAALEAGTPARALALLDDFDLRHPSSSLKEEVAVLRVDALVDAGRLAEASDLAAAFLRAYPGSAYGQHVRSKVNSP